MCVFSKPILVDTNSFQLHIGLYKVTMNVSDLWVLFLIWFPQENSYFCKYFHSYKELFIIEKLKIWIYLLYCI